ncbi:hypothetical protein, partial [Dickeya solani]
DGPARSPSAGVALLRRACPFPGYFERCPIFFRFSAIPSLYLHLSAIFTTLHEQKRHLVLRHTV